MRLLPEDMYDSAIERRMHAHLDEAVRGLESRLDELEAPVIDATQYIAPPNYLPNSHPEWSTLAYGTAGTTPSTAGDTNRECYNWYRHLYNTVTDLVTTSGSPTVDSASNSFTASRFSGTVIFVVPGGGASGATLVGTLTRVSDSQATMSVNAGASLTGAKMYFGTDLTASATYALKRSVGGAEHSLWAANEGATVDIPIWDGTNGTFKFGSSTNNYSIACPLPTDFVFPGQRFFIYFEAALGATDTDINDAEFYAGFWDNTAGQKKWIEGSAFTPTVSVVGVAGSRTLSYKVFAETDSGDQMLSAEVTTTSAPATLTSSNYIKLEFSGAPGFIRYVIYREDGANYYRVGEIRNSIDLQFFDIQETGSSVVPVSGYPTAIGTTPTATALTINFDPADMGTFAAHTMTIQVPVSYNRGNTTNLQQWLRFGVNTLVASGSEREIVIRRLSISEGYGSWTRSPRDMTAASGPTSAATSGPSGGGTTGGPTGGGTGGPTCLTLDTVVKTTGGDKAIGDLTTKDYVVIGPMALPVKRIRPGEVAFVYEIELACGRRLRCSDSHRLIRSQMDRRGISAARLKAGDFLLTEDFTLSRVVRKTKIPGQTRVRQIFLPYPNIFIANGIVNHNRKPVIDPS